MKEDERDDEAWRRTRKEVKEEEVEEEAEAEASRLSWLSRARPLLLPLLPEEEEEEEESASEATAALTEPTAAAAAQGSAERCRVMRKGQRGADWRAAALLCSWPWPWPWPRAGLAPGAGACCCSSASSSSSCSADSRGLMRRLCQAEAVRAAKASRCSSTWDWQRLTMQKTPWEGCSSLAASAR